MRISYWSSDVCSSDLAISTKHLVSPDAAATWRFSSRESQHSREGPARAANRSAYDRRRRKQPTHRERSEEHTSELQSLMRSSYAVFCLKKKNKQIHI